MKLLYLYIENYRCIKDQEFNFDSNYHFHLERKNQEKWELFEDKAKNPLPEDFWASSTGKHNVVESVSAIVGENGSGKTSIANFIGDYIGYYGNENIKFLVIFKYAIDKRPQYWTNIKKIEKKCEIDLIDDNKFPSKKYQRIIYFSPFFTTEYMFISNRTINISTSDLLTQANTIIGSGQGLGKYKSEEYKKALVFLAIYQKEIENRNLPIYLPKPLEILISANAEYAQESLNSIIEEQKLINSLSWHTVKVTNNDDLLVQGNGLPLDQLGAKLLQLFKTVPNDIFLLTFLCYIVSYWRQHIDKEGSTIQTIRNASELDTPPDNTGPEIVELYINCVQEVYSSKSQTNKYEKILKILNKYDKATYVFFISFIDFLTCPNIKVKNNKIEFLFNDLEKTKDKLLDTVNKYNNINLKYDFILYDFYPKMSSGEMSFLTMYSRIYDCITNNREIKGDDELILFLDEAETTLHPEWQRKLVSQIITFLEEFVEKKKIHVIFASHSPILLSDIPDSNVIFLKKDPKTKKSITVSHKEIGKTFGSNIYTLYKNSFFLNGGLMGEFATQKLNVIFDKLKRALDNNSINKDEKENMKKIIDSVGEPLIKEQLLRLLFKATNNYDDVIDYHKKEIKRLEEEIKRLEKENASNK